MERRRRDRGAGRVAAEIDRARVTRFRDRSIALALALALAVVAAILLPAARGDGGSVPPARPTVGQHWTGDPLPAGWHQVDRPLTDVTLPVQVFAAATYPIVLHHPPGRCGPPPAILAEMPPGGALLQVVEDPPRAPDGDPIRVPRLPSRPARFTWADGPWARYECAGPSFKFDYRQAGHALQAQVWMNPATVDPALRAGALRILDDLEEVPPRAGVEPSSPDS